MFDWTWGIGSSGELVGGGLGLVDLNPWSFLDEISHDGGICRWKIFGFVG